MNVERHTFMARTEETADHVRPHAPKPDHSDLHLVLRWFMAIRAAGTPVSSTSRAGRPRRRPDLHRAVVVAGFVARVMKMTIHDVVDMVTVRNGNVLARRPVSVIGGVSTAGVHWCAGRRIDLVDV
jgi:hypothetical protein